MALAAFASPVAAQVQSWPPPSYFNTHNAFHDGDYRAALNLYTVAAQSGLMNTQTLQKWIDSICYQAMMGECQYQLGQNALALAHYTAAIQLYLANADWLTKVQFHLSSLQAANAGQLVATPWHLRVSAIGAYPTYVPVYQGKLNNYDVVANGGVAAPLMTFSVHAQEVVRCTCLAIRRRGELLGPVAPYDPVTAELLRKLVPRPAPAVHWSMAWIDTQLGLAYVSAGKDKQAAEVLTRSVLAAGLFDHPLSGVALLELGRIALRGGDFAGADAYFRNASCAAAQFSDYGTMEEAFRYGTVAHLMAGKTEIYPPLVAAIAWAAAKGLRHLEASLLNLMAESKCVAGMPAEAELALATAAMTANDLLIARLGARFNYTLALSSYQSGNAAVGEAAIQGALTFQRLGSVWLFHMLMADGLWQGKIATDRIAADLFQKVLREPTAADWAFDPLESLSSLVAPHVPMLEHWFELTLKMSKEHERALEITDRVRKHRFLLTQEWGGRLLNLRWVLEGPDELIGNDAVVERQAILGRFPAYEALSRQARQLRAELGEMPLVIDDPVIWQRQKEKLAALAEVGFNQEKMLRAIGLRREPCELVFPPLRTTREVQTLLPDRTALLAFFSTTANSKYAFLITNERSKYRNWEVKLPKNFPRQVVTLLQGWGNFQPNADVSADVLARNDWKPRGRSLLAMLTSQAKTDLAGQFDELVIVPDGILWYVPFEALQFSDGGDTRPLLAKLRMRYVPTVGLGVGNTRPRAEHGNTAVVVGKLYPNDDVAVAEAEFEKLARVITTAEALKGPLPGPSPVFASLIDRLIVFNDVPPAEGGGPYAWAPMQTDRTSQGNALWNWFAFPWGGPDQVILPGFHSPAERGLRDNAGATGDDLFLSICGLMSTGARTVLISRWRPGGQTCYNLMREFVQELPHTSAAESWQRSVLLTQDADIDPDAEPRVKLKAKDAPPRASNPFFWAGYLLADTGSSPYEPGPTMESLMTMKDEGDEKRAVKPMAVPANAAIDAPQAKGRAKAPKRGKPAAGSAAINGPAPEDESAMGNDPDALPLKPRNGARKPAAVADESEIDDDESATDEPKATQTKKTRSKKK
jgi:hypothetical protein